MHVGGVLVVDGQVEREALVERVRERIHLIPRYRMRLEDVAPLGVAYPVWEEDPQFDPDRHVRRVGVPAPGGDAELCELVGDLMSERLDRSRPLWQIIVAQGLEGGRTAVIAKMHHALVDGIAAVDVGTITLDPTPDGMDLGDISSRKLYDNRIPFVGLVQRHEDIHASRLGLSEGASQIRHFISGHLPAVGIRKMTVGNKRGQLAEL